MTHYNVRRLKRICHVRGARQIPQRQQYCTKPRPRDSTASARVGNGVRGTNTRFRTRFPPLKTSRFRDGMTRADRRLDGRWCDAEHEPDSPELDHSPMKHDNRRADERWTTTRQGGR